MTERTAASAVLALGVFSAALLGQTGGQRPPDKPASPASLPGDTLPPFGMLDSGGTLVPQPTRPAGGAARGNAPAQRRRPANTRGPEMALAIEAARAAVESCDAQGFYIGASVIDTSGQPRAMVESNGSDGGHVYVAVRKALVALALKMPSSKGTEAVKTDPSLLSRITPQMFVMEGAVPIYVGSEIIGAIGASGAAGGDADEVCAVAGLEKIKDRVR
jgi:uncharacterized protein GlcG (DUF336 family)